MKKLIIAGIGLVLLLLPSQVPNANASTYNQFISGVKSTQSGTITLASGVTSNTATITSVNTAKTELLFLGFDCTCTPLAADGSEYPYIVLTNATTVTANRVNLNTSSVIVSWRIVEYY